MGGVGRGGKREGEGEGGVRRGRGGEREGEGVPTLNCAPTIRCTVVEKHTQ